MTINLDETKIKNYIENDNRLKIYSRSIKETLEIAPWYVQNILVFAKGKKAELLENKGATAVNSPVMFYHSQLLQDILASNKI